MQDGKAKCNIKLITILSLTALATIVAFLAVIPLCGFKGFDRQAGTSQNNPSYFWRKFEKEPKVAFGVRFLSVALAACCLLGQNVVVVRSYYRQKELKQNSPNINITCSQGQINSCYILTSLTVLFLLPAGVFYFLLNFEQSASYTWLLTCLGMMTLILAIIILGIFIHLAVRSHKEELPKAESAMDECERMQEIFTMKVPQIGLKEEINGDLKNAFDVQGAAQIYETIKTYKQSQQKRNELPIPNSGIPLYAELFSQFQQPKKVNESARKEREALKKNTLLAEIQRRKKKFREVNPLKQYVIEERSQEESQEIDDQNHPKLTNLPKSYRQYIKQSKRPSRKIALKVGPDAPISVEQKINNKFQSVQHEWSLRARAHFTKDAATSKEGELVFQKKIKSKQTRQRKVLFDELGATVGENATEQTEKNEDQLIKKKQNMKKDPSREDNLLQILKRKYSEDQQ